jgi:probable phosphoglycerate mutase
MAGDAQDLAAHRHDPPDGDEALDPFLSLKRGGCEIYLIRHADALPGAEDLLPGDYDAQNLSELGRKQAQALAERLRRTRFDALYSSPIGRTLQTAEPLAAALGLPVTVVPDLREIELGAIVPAPPEGATSADMAAYLRDRLRAIALRAATTGSWDSIPDSEPPAAFRARVVAAHDQLAARHPGGRVACFGHGGTINVYLASILGLAQDFLFPVANTAITIARVKGERRVLLALNDVCHLRDAGLLELPD